MSLHVSIAANVLLQFQPISLGFFARKNMEKNLSPKTMDFSSEGVPVGTADQRFVKLELHFAHDSHKWLKGNLKKDQPIKFRRGPFSKPMSSFRLVRSN